MTYIDDNASILSIDCTYARIPRKTKKALKKSADWRQLTPREIRRVRRFLAGVSAMRVVSGGTVYKMWGEE